MEGDLLEAVSSRRPRHMNCLYRVCMDFVAFNFVRISSILSHCVHDPWSGGGIFQGGVAWPTAHLPMLKSSNTDMILVQKLWAQNVMSNSIHSHSCGNGKGALLLWEGNGVYCLMMEYQTGGKDRVSSLYVYRPTYRVYLGTDSRFQKPRGLLPQYNSEVPFLTSLWTKGENSEVVDHQR